MRQNPPTKKVVLMMAMALGDGAVENDRLIVTVSVVIDAVRKIPPGSGAVKTLYDQYAFQESNLVRIIHNATITDHSSTFVRGKTIRPGRFLPPAIHDRVNVVVMSFFDVL